MLIQKNDILCSYVLHKTVERVNYIVKHPKEFYTEFHRYKTDKIGNKRLNKPQYKEKYGEFWTRVINPPKDELKEISLKSIIEILRIKNYSIKNSNNSYIIFTK